MISLKFKGFEEAIEHLEDTLRIGECDYTLDLENGIYVAIFDENILEPLFNIGDKFSVHFDYYKPNERTEHIITKIDTSFEEANEIVYWSSEDLVYITELELSKQQKFNKGA